MQQEIYTSKPVAVVLCTYNGEKYIAAQLQSIIEQTYPHLEIIIADDASTDNTRELLVSFQQKDKRIKLFFNETNLGYNKNFEKAIGLATADFIAISDQDDVWELNKIEMMMRNWPANSLFVYSLSGSFWGNDSNTDGFEERKAAPPVLYTSINDTHKLVFSSPVHGHACMFKKELLAYSIPFPGDIFYDWWLSMFAASLGTIGCIPETLTWHRVHDNNSSRNITSIKDTAVRNQRLREQCAYFIETFFKRHAGKEEERTSLLYYASLLKKMDGKTFSWNMFRFVLKNRYRIFHYKKKKPFLTISHLKHAWRMGYKGLL